MRKLSVAFREELATFVDQRRQLLLVVEAGPAEYVALLKTLESLEASREDVFWTFPLPFTGESQFADAVVAHLCARLEVLRARPGYADAFPDPPASAQSCALPGVTRVRDVLVHARSLIADLTDHAMVITLAPPEVTDPEAFARFVRELLAHDVQAPWCHHMRFIVRDGQDRGSFRSLFERAARVAFYRPDLSQPAIERALEDEANDDEAPLPERMQSLLLLAALDTAHHRPLQAVEKYRLLHRYHAALGDAGAAALCLNGLGEAYARAGHDVPAQSFFERALTKALAAKALPIVLSATVNLAHLHLRHARYAEGFEYWQALEQLAQALCNPALKLQALQHMGMCRQQSGDYDGALRHWRAAIVLAEGLQATQEHLACLRRVRAMFRDASMHAHVSEVDRLMVRVAEGAKEQGVA